MRILFLLTIPLFLISCSPEKRLARLVKSHPHLVSRDTIFRQDTTIIAEVWRDTVFTHTISKDTLVIREKHLEIKYYNDGKNVYLKGKCDTVFVVKEIPVVVNSVNPVTEVNKLTWWQKALMLTGVLALIFIVLDLFVAWKKRN